MLQFESDTQVCKVVVGIVFGGGSIVSNSHPALCLVKLGLILGSLSIMFSAVGLFKQLRCPEGSQCQLLNCLFTHAAPSPYTTESAAPAESLVDREEEAKESNFLGLDPPRKRRRIDDKLEHVRLEDSTSTQDEITKTLRVTDTNSLKNGHSQKNTEYVDHGLSTSTNRPVSPPPLRDRRGNIDELELATTKSRPHHRNTAKSQIPAKKPSAQNAETLNPRMINKPPAAHTVRLKLVNMLFEQMTRLNEEIMASKDNSRDALVLSPQEIITEVLDEEERIAKENSAVYANILKLRIVALKKMKIDEWKDERLRQIAQQYPQQVPSKAIDSPVSLDTGLQTEEDITLLSKMTARPEDLVKHGYVFTPPSVAEIEQARQGKDAANGWEQCDRCKSRFQVFPGRRAEDGALTTGGNCFYHHGKPRRLTREKADSGYKDTTYSCCSQGLGTLGCTMVDTHVFKVSEPKALALVMQFEKTPLKGSQSAESAVCFDCEMGYTTLGMELIRLTATSWPDGKELLDVLVRPIGEILDLNSRFSGVWPQHYSDALPYKLGSRNRGAKTGENPPGTQLYMVDSPAVARELLFDLLTTQTPLMGHALENDLNAVRIIHPTIVDTVLLYPHPHGLPIRYGLKMLVKRYLNRDIQMGGAQGHDSKEDAVAAGDLIRLKVLETWKTMTRDGWTFDKGVLNAPLPRRPTPSQEQSVIEASGVKRKHL